jgi:hypothetical protein
MEMEQEGQDLTFTLSNIEIDRINKIVKFDFAKLLQLGVSRQVKERKLCAEFIISNMHRKEVERDLAVAYSLLLHNEYEIKVYLGL